MAYQKHTWENDEIISAERLNAIENGIAEMELTPGPTGPQGPAGTNGLGWLFGTNVPNSEGRDGDLYLKTDNFDVYKKVSGSWQKVGNIKGSQGPTGPAGATGAQGERGETGPQGPKGADAVLQDATTEQKGVVKQAAKVDAVSQANLSNPSTSYTQAEVQKIVEMANANKTVINSILTALKNAGIMKGQ